MKWMTACFKFFASLRLGIILLVALGLSLAAGTFVESAHGADAAKLLVYHTPWFRLLLILLGLNLLASALDRWPWKQKHVGFLTTHLGIILILAGSLVSQAFAVEGQLAIAEGETGSRMTLSDPFVQVVSADGAGRWLYPLKPHPLPWTGRSALKGNKPAPFKLILLKDYPKAKATQGARESETGAPALHVSLHGLMASVEEWLFLESPTRNRLSLGPAVIQFAKSPIAVPKASNEEGHLDFQFENGSTIQVPVTDERVGNISALGDTPYQIRITRILKDAIVEENQLIDRSEELNNPAVELVLEGKDFTERHTVFARFPEFPTAHGLAPSKAGVRITYQMPAFPGGAGQNELRLIFKPGGLPGYQIKHGKNFKEGTVELGRPVETGWMDFRFQVDQYWERAEPTSVVEPLPNHSESMEAQPMIEVALEAGSENAAAWLSQGEASHLEAGGTSLHVIYGLKVRPLGFQIKLRDFMIETDPGTDRPASFKSDVTLQDPSRGLEREVTIQMNEPLNHRGYQVYQSAYQLRPGEPEVSIFTVARDPGNPIKYAGAIIMISGIIALFYAKPLSTLKVVDPQLRTK